MKKQKSKIVDGIFYGIEVTIEDEKPVLNPNDLQFLTEVDVGYYKMPNRVN